jgi:hypothetical protein
MVLENNTDRGILQFGSLGSMGGQAIMLLFLKERGRGEGKLSALNPMQFVSIQPPPAAAQDSKWQILYAVVGVTQCKKGEGQFC